MREPPVRACSGRLEEYFEAHAVGPGIWKWRHYFPAYERHLGRFVGRAPTVVEIGVYGGGSLRMWHEYFGSGTLVYGIDIEPACRTYETEGIRILIGDQADPEFLDAVVADAPGGIDVVLDDGGHKAHQQRASFEALFPHLRPGGVYVVEDVHGGTHPFLAYIDGVARSLHRMGRDGASATPVQAAVESISVYPFLVVVEKRAVPVDRLDLQQRGTEWQPF